MSTPELKFEWIRDRLSPWHKWADRNQINGAELPGIYLLAHFESPPRIVDPTDKRVIYVGITGKKPSSNQALKWRWQQFRQSAFGAKDGPHSGGNTYQKEFGRTHEAKLYVSALAIAREHPWYSAFILAAERLLIWEYALRHNGLPTCNKE